MAKIGVYIDGDWVESDYKFDVFDFVSGEFATVQGGTRSDIRAAVSCSSSSQKVMKESTLVERRTWMEEIADGLSERREQIVESIVREAGKPISSARSEVDSSIERFRRAKEEISSISGDYIEGTTEGHEGWRAIVKPEPLGPILIIAPYNYPLATTALQVAPALAAGNTVVLKPSSYTPTPSIKLAEVIQSTSIPDGAFNLISGESSSIGDMLASQTEFRGVMMTGSSGAGKKVADTSGISRLHLELGGNAPALVLSDSDIQTAAECCANGSFKYSGQRCSAISRILCHQDVHNTLVDLIEEEMSELNQGKLFNEETDVSPLISEEQASWVDEIVQDASEKGAQIIQGGIKDGRYYEPTLLANVPRNARIMREEQFGPVAVVSKLPSEEEILSEANSGSLALDASIFTSDYDNAIDMANQLNAGSVRINGSPSHGLGDIPFGGRDDSGIGRQGLSVTIDDLMESKSIIL